MRKQTIYPCPVCDYLLIEEVVIGPTEPFIYYRRLLCCIGCDTQWKFSDLVTDGGVARLTNMTQPYT